MVRYTDHPAMTIAVDLGRKARKKTKQTVSSIDVRIYHEGADENICPKDHCLSSRGLPSDDKR